MTSGQHEQPRWLNRVYARVIYPIFDPRSYGRFSDRLQRYQRIEGSSLEANRELQWQALTRLLAHAYDSSPFYRQRFDQAGVRPSDIASSADLRKIPPLTRDDLRNHLAEIQSRRYRPEELMRSATGGTTDTPVPLLRDPECVREKVAVQWQFNSWAGLFPGDKVFYLWGARFDLPQNPSWRYRLYDRHLMRRVWAPTSDLSEEVLESYRQTLNQLRPRIIYAYPRALALFCEFLRACGRPYVRPKAAICTAELLFPEQRQVIEAVLGCPVFDHYGTRDFGLPAAECEEHRGLHVNPLVVYFEYLPVKDAEVEGLREILVTDLLNYGMPMIRYQVNDCAVVDSEACPCGRGFPLIKGLVGRTSDLFRLADGAVVMGGSLLSRAIGQACRTLRKIQIIQETFTEFRLRFVPGEDFAEEDLKLLEKRLDEYFGVQLQWKFEKVEDIERERSGKTRLCISRVTNPLVR